MGILHKVFGNKKTRKDVIAKPIPFRTFSGFLKQLAPENLSTLEQELFELLFPLFQGTSDADIAYKNWADHPLTSALAPLIEVAPGDRRPRRFSGYDFPSSRYYALCKDINGCDAQTLAHELRAYRDPIDLGMVEVLDLANGCQLGIRNTVVTLPAELAIAVLIHEPQNLPDKFRALKFQNVPGLQDQPLLIYRFPYKVHPCKIEQTIDLRFPDVRNWFYQTFHDLPDAIHVGPIPGGGPETTPTIAHSRFHFENGQPPVPDSFWSMLPTLINPDIGGGSPADTGSTLLLVGHWMRQNNVSALIYPSARCDTTAIFEKGGLKEWQGWSLVDYRDSPFFSTSSIKLSTFVLSPWAWVELPSGVELHIAAEGSSLTGSFVVQNMVNYWAEDYLGQLKALEVARAIHGREKPRNQRRTPLDGLVYRAFQIGSLSIRWVRMIIQGVTAEQIENIVLELQGLALPYGMYSMTGRILELWSGVKERTIPINDLLQASLATNDLLFRFLSQQNAKDEFDKLATIGADLELILFFLAMRAKAGTKVKAASMNVSGFLGEIETALTTHWLDDNLKNLIREFHRNALHEVESGDGKAEFLLEDGIRLHQAIYNYLRAKDDNQRS